MTVALASELPLLPFQVYVGDVVPHTTDGLEAPATALSVCVSVCVCVHVCVQVGKDNKYMCSGTSLTQTLRGPKEKLQLTESSKYAKHTLYV